MKDATESAGANVLVRGNRGDDVSGRGSACDGRTWENCPDRRGGTWGGEVFHLNRNDPGPLIGQRFWV